MPHDRAAHIAPVLEAIYGAYGLGWMDGGSDTGLAAAALFLGRLPADAVPSSAETKGLLALMLYADSRRDARRYDGRFVPLEEQDVARWDHRSIAEAEEALYEAAALGNPGPFQLEATIQSIHAHRAVSGTTDWHGIAQIYSVLMAHYPSVGAFIGWAASLAREDRVADDS